MKCLILLLLSAGVLAIADDHIDIIFGTTAANPATSCNEIYQHNPASRGTIGQYYIKTCDGAQKVICNIFSYDVIQTENTCLEYHKLLTALLEYPMYILPCLIVLLEYINIIYDMTKDSVFLFLAGFYYNLLAK